MGTRSFPHRAGAAVLGLAAIVGAATAAGYRQERPLDELKWIVGCWTMQTARGENITERWHRAAPDTLAGISRTMKGDSELGSEIMHIFERGDTITFAALPSGRTYTEFTATSVSADSAVFENAAHDFPQRISYRLAGDSLHALVSGTMSGSAMNIAFPMKKVACEGA